MADTKISALPASTTPLAGTEVLPIVQSSATKQVSVENLTAGRAISATQITLTAGNVIPANGYGVDFSATSGTGTSELLADYEEGTFTPTLTRSSSAPTVTYTVQKGFYIKVGNAVTCSVYLQWSANSGGAGYYYVASLPFTSKTTASCVSSSAIGDYTGFTLAVGTTQLGLEVNNNVTFGVFQCSGSAVSSNVVSTVAATGFVILSVTYFTT
jgi:hypothetical protein